MVFIAVDGIDGAGKTTLVAQLAEMLQRLRPLVTKEPTSSSEWGRALRNSAIRQRLPRDVEIEYFHKDRLHHLASEILPALEEGRAVICDRYVDSTLAFQANDPEDADRMYERFLTEIRVPDVTFILDCAVETGLERIRDRNNGFSAFENTETLERAQKIYRSRRGTHYVHIDASNSIAETFDKARQHLIARFPDRIDLEPSQLAPIAQSFRRAVGSS